MNPRTRGLVTIETDGSVFWWVEGTRVNNHPGIDANFYQYISNPDMAQEVEDAVREGAELPYVLDILKRRY